MTKNHALYVHFTRYFGLMQAQQPKVPFETCMSVLQSNKDAHVHFIRQLMLLQLHQPKVPYIEIKCSSVSARSRDARIHYIRLLGLLQAQQAKMPCVRYTSVSALCRDARLYYVHRGSARSHRASMRNFSFCLLCMQASLLEAETLVYLTQGILACCACNKPRYLM